MTDMLIAPSNRCAESCASARVGYDTSAASKGPESHSAELTAERGPRPRPFNRQFAAQSRTFRRVTEWGLYDAVRVVRHSARLICGFSLSGSDLDWGSNIREDQKENWKVHFLRVAICRVSYQTHIMLSLQSLNNPPAGPQYPPIFTERHITPLCNVKSQWYTDPWLKETNLRFRSE